METMAEENSVNERWENVVEHEIQFYLNFSEYETEIKERLLENELDIQLPTTIFDEELGRVYIRCPSTEDQALKRIEVRDSLNALLEKGKKRAERVLRSYYSLSDHEQEIIFYTYFEPLSDREFSHYLSVRPMKNIPKVKQRALRELFRIYEKDRAEQNKEWAETLKIERQKMADSLRQQMKIS